MSIETKSEGGMRTRVLGRTGFQVTEIGYGAWPIGNNRNAEYGDVDEQEAIEVVRTYLEAGGNFIDTARAYGERSERVIGTVVKEFGLRDKVYIATKSWAGQTIDTIPQLRKDLEQSLRLLQTEYVDLYQLHQPPEDEDVMNRVLDEMERMKDEGRVRAIGASIKGPNVTPMTAGLCRQYMKTGRVDAIQLVYSILRQELYDVIQEAEKQEVGIVARTALESGLLTGKYRPGHRFSGLDQRRRYSDENLQFILRTVEEIGKERFPAPYENLAQVAIRFALEPSGVSTVIVGAHRVKNLKANVEAAQLPPLDEPLVQKLRKRYGGITERANYG